jgi:hypothetical protein
LGDRPQNRKKIRAHATAQEFCGFQCPHSNFAPPETAGLCRTMAAVYCKKLKKLVNKNGPCVWQAKPRQKQQIPRKR